jgi:hypothetical protein
MRPTRLILVVVWLLLLAGFAEWARSGTSHPSGVSALLWIGAFLVLCLPLVLLALDALTRRQRHR